MLFIWPVVTIVLFRLRPLNEALAWTIIAGYMLLPRITAFDLPLLPAWDKELVPSLFAAIMCFALVASDKTSRQGRATQRVDAGGPIADGFTIRRGKVLFWGLIVLLFGSPLITVMNNSEPLIDEERYLSGLKLYDGLSMNLNLLVTLTPFFLARRFLNSPESHAILLRILVVAAIGYSILALYEVRMSPQLNSMIYGFFPHSWRQHVRYGGFRPIIFLNHGLWVAILFSMSIIAAGALWRQYKAKAGSLRWLGACLWLFFTLVLCKSLGSLIITTLLLPLVLFAGVRFQLLAASSVAAIVMIYPGLRGANLMPTDQIYSLASTIDTERAASLKYRLDAEDILLAHANQKPLAGWGSNGRNRAKREKGLTLATDGYWVIIVGVYGWLGYIAQFGLLGLSTVFLAFNKKRLNLSFATAGLSLIVAGALIDLIPNASISPITWLAAGALMGRYQTAHASAKSESSRRIRPSPAKTEGAELSPVPAEKKTPDISPTHLHIRKPREG